MTLIRFIIALLTIRLGYSQINSDQIRQFRDIFLYLNDIQISSVIFVYNRLEDDVIEEHFEHEIPILVCNCQVQNCSEGFSLTMSNTMIILVNQGDSISTKRVLKSLTVGQITSNGWILPSSVEIPNDLLRFDAQIYLWDQSDAEIILEEIYSIGWHQVREVIPKLSDSEEKDFIWNRRSQLFGHQLKIGYAGSDHLWIEVFYKFDDDDNLISEVLDRHSSCQDLIRMFSFKTLEKIVSMMNATLRCIKYDTWGKQGLDTKEWKGIIQGIMINEVDIGLELTNTLERKEVIDFSMPLTDQALVYVIKRPEVQYQMASIFGTSRLSYWIALSVADLAILIVLLTINRLRIGHSNL